MSTLCNTPANRPTNNFSRTTRWLTWASLATSLVAPAISHAGPYDGRVPEAPERGEEPPDLGKLELNLAKADQDATTDAQKYRVIRGRAWLNVRRGVAAENLGHFDPLTQNVPRLLAADHLIWRLRTG